ncbi:sugar transferase [Candidatus Poribacteria bacterium]|nr:sugar transferase [Candidatus Poribacteria bacterium]
MRAFYPHKVILAIIDFIAINSSFLFVLWLQDQPTSLPYHHIPAFLIFSLIQIFIFQLHQLYKYQVFLNPFTEIFQLLKSLSYGISIFIVISFLMKSRYLIQSYFVMGSTFMLTFLLLAILRCLLARRFYFYLVAKGKIGKDVLIVGNGRRGREIAKTIGKNKHAYFRIIGFMDEMPDQGANVLGTLADLPGIVQKKKGDEIIVCVDETDPDQLLKIIRNCQAVGLPIHVISELYQVLIEKGVVEEFGGIPTVKFPSTSAKITYTMAKRAIDVIGASVGILMLSPLFLVLAIIIKLTSEGPVFYRTTVVGKDGKEFTWSKFRSMKADNDNSAHKQLVREMIANPKNDGKKLQNDPRITGIGKFIRKYSVDELPQLFNVWKGQMSLVGPRPVLPYEYELLQPWQKERFKVIPGITGLWQITGRNEVCFNDAVVLDLYYIENRSFWLDLEILLKTIPVVLFGRGGQ